MLEAKSGKLPPRQRRHLVSFIAMAKKTIDSDLSVLHEIYTPPAVTAIQNRANSGNRLDVLCDILGATNKRFGIARAHLCACLQFAQDQHGLDGDRVRRLREPTDYPSWKAVHNELLVPFFFAKVFELRIKFTTKAPTRGLGDFEIVLPTDHIVVEVKTPRGDILAESRSEDDQCAVLDEHLLESVFRDAAKEVQPGNKNLIVISTRLCESILDSRAFEKLLYGHKTLSVAFDQKQRNAVERLETFVRDGHLIKHCGRRFTRISAVASFREDVIFQVPVSDSQQQVHFAVLHNYHAKCPISPEHFPGVEQFVVNKEKGRIEQINSGCNGFTIDTQAAVEQ